MTPQPAASSVNRAPENTPFSVQLFERLEQSLHIVARQSEGENPVSTEALRRWFVLSSQATQASVPLLDWACQQLPRWPSGPFTELLAEYYMLNAVEERRYQRHDLPGGASGELPDRHIAAIIGSQYYLTRHYHPALLLGYIAFCEASPPEVLQGLPVRHLRFHAEEDRCHLEELRGVLDEVPPEPPSLRQAVVANAMRCVAAYAAVIDSLFQPAPDRRALLPR